MTTNPDDDFYERVTSRIFRVTLAIAAAGTMAALAWRGWRVGAGFALGAAISWINFRWAGQEVPMGVAISEKLLKPYVPERPSARILGKNA